MGWRLRCRGVLCCKFELRSRQRRLPKLERSCVGSILYGSSLRDVRCESNDNGPLVVGLRLFGENSVRADFPREMTQRSTTSRYLRSASAHPELRRMFAFRNPCHLIHGTFFDQRQCPSGIRA